MKITKMIVFPDIHAPKHHKPSLKSALKFTKQYKPDIFIQLGDLCDYDSLGRFDVLKEKDLTNLDHEVKSANKVLDQIEASLPKKCRKIICEGNHDRRPETYSINNMSKELKKIIGANRLPYFHEAYKLEERGWEWVPEGKCFGYGKALFTHGWFTNLHHAHKTVHRWFKNIFYGHTHTVQEYTINGIDGHPVSAVSIGTLSRFDLSYMRELPTNWCHAFGKIEFFGSNGRFTPQIIKIINGKFCMNGVVYE